jgi:hypothetical protein
LFHKPVIRGFLGWKIGQGYTYKLCCFCVAGMFAPCYR